MSYTIPNDTGHPWRLHKFIDYHSLGDADMNFPILIKYADAHGMTTNQRFWFAFLYSTCYCVPTTCFLYEAFLDENTTGKLEKESLEKFWEKFKPKMIFQSDKRYVKNMNWFVEMVQNFMHTTEGNPQKYFKKFKRDTPQEVWDALYKEILKWQYFGRFTTFLLIEAISKLTPLKADSDWFDWKNGNTATSGMMHILYLDDEADEFDKSVRLDPEVKAKLEKRLLTLKKKIKERYPEASTNIADIETALCGYRKLFKQSRYGGYYIDRVQEEIATMEKSLPQEKALWKELWKHRKDAFNPIFLGELQGYYGVQKERNHEWVERGVCGVEAISKY